MRRGMGNLSVARRIAHGRETVAYRGGLAVRIRNRLYVRITHCVCFYRLQSSFNSTALFRAFGVVAHVFQALLNILITRISSFSRFLYRSSYISLGLITGLFTPRQ